MEIGLKYKYVTTTIGKGRIIQYRTRRSYIYFINANLLPQFIAVKVYSYRYSDTSTQVFHRLFFFMKVVQLLKQENGVT